MRIVRSEPGENRRGCIGETCAHAPENDRAAPVAPKGPRTNPAVSARLAPRCHCHAAPAGRQTAALTRAPVETAGRTLPSRTASCHGDRNGDEPLARRDRAARLGCHGRTRQLSGGRAVYGDIAWIDPDRRPLCTIGSLATSVQRQDGKSSAGCFEPAFSSLASSGRHARSAERAAGRDRPHPTLTLSGTTADLPGPPQRRDQLVDRDDEHVPIKALDAASPHEAQDRKRPVARPPASPGGQTKPLAFAPDPGAAPHKSLVFVSITSAVPVGAIATEWISPDPGHRSEWRSRQPSRSRTANAC